MIKSSIERLIFPKLEDYVVHAARTCYDSHLNKNSEPRTEAENTKLLKHLVKSGHLTTSEHARINLVMPMLNYEELEGLAYMPVHPTYRRYKTGMRSDVASYAIMGLNLTHIRNMVFQNDHLDLSFLGHELAHVLKPSAPSVLSDIDTTDCFAPLVREIRDNEMSLEQRKIFKNYSFHVIGSRSLGNQLVRHRLLSQDQRCVIGSTWVLQGGQGKDQLQTKKVTIEELYRRFQRPQYKGRSPKIRCVNTSNNLVYGPVKEVFFTGNKPVYKVNTSLGYSIECTENHRFLTLDNNYKELSQLSVGSTIYANGVSLLDDKKWLYEQYVILERSQKEIGALSGFSHHWVRKHISKYGFQKPRGTGMTGKVPWNFGKTKHTDSRMLSTSIKNTGKKGHQKEGLDNTFWKGANVINPRDRCKKWDDTAPVSCERCRTNIWKHRHHIDKNILNNDRTNIAYVCPSCHKEIHSGIPSWKVMPVIIESIEYVGIKPTYDLEMDTLEHNFVANGLVTHNSQRYCDEGEFDVVRPPEAPVNSREEAYTGLPTGSGYFDMNFWSQQLQGIYKLLRIEGWTKGAARCILPNAAVTQLVVTGNMLGIRHFLKLRCASDAQPEIRYIAIRMHQHISADDPELVEDIEYSTKDLEHWLD